MRREEERRGEKRREEEREIRPSRLVLSSSSAVVVDSFASRDFIVCKSPRRGEEKGREVVCMCKNNIERERKKDEKREWRVERGEGRGESGRGERKGNLVYVIWMSEVLFLSPLEKVDFHFLSLPLSVFPFLLPPLFCEGYSY